MTCDEVRPLLDAWQDDELPATTAVAVAEHVAQCDACVRRLRADAVSREVVRNAWPKLDAPDMLVARVRAEMAGDAQAAAPRTRVAGPSTPGRRASSRPWMRAAAAVALVTLGSVGTLIVTRETGPRDADTESLIARQVDALVAHRSISVVSSEHHTVKPWFAGRVEFSPPVPVLDSVGISLAGARVDTVGGRRAAVLEYHKRLHVIGVFVQYAPSVAREAPMTSSDARGYHVVRWHAGDLSFAAVSDLNLPELRAFAEVFRRGQ